jgi:hypothetical protein
VRCGHSSVASANMDTRFREYIGTEQQQCRCTQRWTPKTRSRWDYLPPHPASRAAISAAPVITDRSPPSSSSAAVCASLSLLVPSQMASLLGATAQPDASTISIIGNSVFINPSPGLHFSAFAIFFRHPKSEVGMTAKYKSVHPDTLRKLIRYDADTGKLYWLARHMDMFKSRRSMNIWNSRYAEKEAFTANSYGYRQGTLLGFHVLAHHVVWALNTGAWADLEIDHIDGDRSNNSIDNLREVTRHENTKNLKLFKTNKTGCAGVRKKHDMVKWTAEIHHNGKNHYLGSFNTFEDAVTARRKAERDFGFHENHNTSR